MYCGRIVCSDACSLWEARHGPCNHRLGVNTHTHKHKHTYIYIYIYLYIYIKSSSFYQPYRSSKGYPKINWNNYSCVLSGVFKPEQSYSSSSLDVCLSLSKTLQWKSTRLWIKLGATEDGICPCSSFWDLVCSCPRAGKDYPLSSLVSMCCTLRTHARTRLAFIY